MLHWPSGPRGYGEGEFQSSRADRDGRHVSGPDWEGRGTCLPSGLNEREASSPPLLDPPECCGSPLPSRMPRMPRRVKGQRNKCSGFQRSRTTCEDRGALRVSAHPLGSASEARRARRVGARRAWCSTCVVLTYADRVPRRSAARSVQLQQPKAFGLEDGGPQLGLQLVAGAVLGQEQVVEARMRGGQSVRANTQHEQPTRP